MTELTKITKVIKELRKAGVARFKCESFEVSFMPAEIDPDEVASAALPSDNEVKWISLDSQNFRRIPNVYNQPELYTDGHAPFFSKTPDTE